MGVAVDEAHELGLRRVRTVGVDVNIDALAGLCRDPIRVAEQLDLRHRAFLSRVVWSPALGLEQILHAAQEHGVVGVGLGGVGLLFDKAGGDAAVA